MIEIELTQGKKAIVDDEFAHLRNWKWRFSGGYAARSFTASFKNRKGMFLHHCIIGKPLNGFQVDHINGNVLDNRKDNLRIVSARENMQNSKSRREGGNSSKLIGVTWWKPTKQWRAQIYIDRRKRHLGLFITEEDAHRAYLFALGKNKGRTKV